MSGLTSKVSAEEKKPVSVSENNINLPKNLFDNFEFEKENATIVQTTMLLSVPVIYFSYGIYKWQWGSVGNFSLHPEKFPDIKSDAGDADKYGHLYGAYVFTRFGAFTFKAAGSSRLESVLWGALFSEALLLFSEIGDGYTKYYGFDPHDILFNNIGIFFGMILWYFPFLDNIFAFQWEYVPSRATIERIRSYKVPHLVTDYSGQKFLITIKPVGIPYLSLTPLRYVNIDLGFYSRGYYPSKYFNSETRNYFFGISVNYSIVSGDLLPVGYFSSTMQTFFNYYHLPLDWEAKTWEISKR